MEIKKFLDIIVIKNLNINCKKKKINCNMHPHNYYLEILSELGIIGFFIFLLFFLIIFYQNFLLKNIFKSSF